MLFEQTPRPQQICRTQHAPLRFLEARAQTESLKVAAKLLLEARKLLCLARQLAPALARRQRLLAELSGARRVETGDRRRTAERRQAFASPLELGRQDPELVARLVALALGAAPARWHVLRQHRHVLERGERGQHSPPLPDRRQRALDAQEPRELRLQRLTLLAELLHPALGVDQRLDLP